MHVQNSSDLSFTNTATCVEKCMASRNYCMEDTALRGYLRGVLLRRNGHHELLSLPFDFISEAIAS